MESLGKGCYIDLFMASTRGRHLLGLMQNMLFTSYPTFAENCYFRNGQLVLRGLTGVACEGKLGPQIECNGFR